MLTIRMQRVGRKHEPIFRLVLTDSKNGAKSGKFLQILGNYDARRGEQATFDTDAVKHWISKGAKPSDTVFNMLVERKVVEGKKINKLPKKTATKKDEPVAEAPKPELASTEEPSKIEEKNTETKTEEETVEGEKQV